MPSRGSSKQTAADRRAVVERMRRDAARRERRTTWVVVAAAGTVAAVILGVVAWQVARVNEESGRALADLGVAEGDAGCQPVATTAAQGNNDHRPEGERILYQQAPPAAGPHWGQFLVGTQIRPFWTADDRPPVERLVHSLEHGHTILWYDATVADDDEARADVEAVATKAAAEVGGKFMAAPWTSADGAALPSGTRYVLTHWSMGGTHGNPQGQLSVRQECDGLSGEVVASFLDDYPPSDAPEPGAA